MPIAMQPRPFTFGPTSRVAHGREESHVSGDFPQEVTAHATGAGTFFGYRSPKEPIFSEAFDSSLAMSWPVK